MLININVPHKQNGMRLIANTLDEIMHLSIFGFKTNNNLGKHAANSCFLCFSYVIPTDNRFYLCRIDVIQLYLQPIVLYTQK